MPTPYKTTGNMTKHLTKSERAAREKAERSLSTSKRVMLKAPEWLSEEAKKVFDTTKRRMKQFEILEVVDVDVLAMYSDAVARYQKLICIADDDYKAASKAQSWSRLALSYAEKLGITATGRARLARRKAEEKPVDDMESLLSEVTEFVNSDQ
jgi:phage terminase small subunit